MELSGEPSSGGPVELSREQSSGVVEGVVQQRSSGVSFLERLLFMAKPIFLAILKTSRADLIILCRSVLICRFSIVIVLC